MQDSLLFDARPIVSLTTLRDRKDSIRYFTINRNDKFPRSVFEICWEKFKLILIDKERKKSNPISARVARQVDTYLSFKTVSTARKRGCRLQIQRESRRTSRNIATTWQRNQTGDENVERKGGISGEWNDRKRDRGDGEERTHRKIGIPIHGKKSGKGKKERKKDNDPKWNRRGEERRRKREKEWKRRHFREIELEFNKG